MGDAFFNQEEIMSKELAKTYDPKGLEDRLYQKWMDNVTSGDYMKYYEDMYSGR